MYTIHTLSGLYSIPIDPENFEKNKGIKVWTLKLLEKITVQGEKFSKKNSLILSKNEITSIFLSLNCMSGIC